MAEISVHRREKPSGGTPVVLNWADRLFNELTPSRIFRELMPSMMKDQGELIPAFDISESDDHFVVKADLPGIDPKSLDISLAGNVLTIRGEKKEEREFGSFIRSFMMPADVKEDGIEASYKDGVLRVNIPKSQRAEQKKISVKMS